MGESSNLVARLREAWKELDPTDAEAGYDTDFMMGISVLLAETAQRLERLEGEHENIARGRVPTHRCKVCDTFWLDLPEYNAMTMVGVWCGETCCEGANIEPLPAVQAELKRRADEIERLQKANHEGGLLAGKTIQENLGLRAALNESVKLQSHYARLLNGYDGGTRLTFDADSWIARLQEIGGKISLPPTEESRDG